MLALSTPQVAVVVSSIVVAVAIAAFAMWKAFHMPWPSGKRTVRDTAARNEIVVIDDTADEALIAACSNATNAIFAAWRAYVAGSDPSAALPVVGVHFVDDSIMDDVQDALFKGERVAAYLSKVSSSVKTVPLAVIRKSHALEVIETGQPLMHEILHALMSYYFPNAPGQRDHTHPTWNAVQEIAVKTYRDLWGPKRLT